MKRADLEHVIRAAAVISGDDDIVVIDNQAILGQFPTAPAELCVSDEADVYPRNHPERADLIDGSIGELSPFRYYAQGVAPETATAPAGWQERLVRVHNANTRGATGWCLEIHDLLISKHVAGREKDRDFTAIAARHRLAERRTLEERLALTEVDDVIRQRVRGRIALDFA